MLQYQCVYSGPNSRVYLGEYAKKVIHRMLDNTLNISGVREIGIVSYLDFLRPHPNIIKFVNVNLTQEGIIISMSRANSDLSTLIYNNDIKLSITNKNDIANQIIAAVRFCHENHIMHRDIKPNNILIYDNNHVTLTDFGAAKSVVAPMECNLTGNLYTLFYRAPEILVNNNYNFAADIWSLGCTLAELYLRRTIFEATPISEQAVLQQIVRHCGLPVEQGFRSKVVDLVGNVGVESNILKKIRAQNLAMAKNIKKMLNVNVRQRLTFLVTDNIDNVVNDLWPQAIPLATQKVVAKFVLQFSLGFDCYWVILKCLSHVYALYGSEYISLDVLYAVFILVVKIKAFELYNFEKMIPRYWHQKVIVQEMIIAAWCSNIIILPTPLELAYKNKNGLDHEYAVKTLVRWIINQVPLSKNTSEIAVDLCQ